ncbi:hypothetical protein [Bacillus sp. REN3]|uniref:hypothetical protein n=1 Tax=Bacillus sp. REN3 TaxID=2802440 RepID=UPI001AED52D2|nr:hypothetical protein [Bacillus sp. REN3]
MPQSKQNDLQEKMGAMDLEKSFDKMKDDRLMQVPCKKAAAAYFTEYGLILERNNHGIACSPS